MYGIMAMMVRMSCSGQNKPMMISIHVVALQISEPDTRNRKGRITSYNHDAVGAKLCSKFLEFYTDDEVFINKVAMMVKYHMHMLYVLKNLPFGNRIKMISDTDIHDLALLCRCDRLGRIGADKEEETNNYYEFLKRCQVPL